MTDRSEKDDDSRALILIVDDVPKNIQVLGNILSGEGYRIAAATGGLQGLEMIRGLKPDILLLDIMMPDLDGLELCRMIKESPDTMELPVIFITAKTEIQDVVHGFNAGAVDFITKPFNSVELLVRIKTHLKLKASLDSQRLLVVELQKALSKVKLLSGLLPICSHCKKIRDDEGSWRQVDEFVGNRSEAVFSHSICPDCLQQYYPDYADRVNNDD